jgi:hypothetical protein
MKELIDYRRRLVERLAEAANEFYDACEEGDSSRIVEGDWTLHQVASHVRDIDRSVYNARVRRTLQEEAPLFESVDPDEWMARNYNGNEPLKNILDEFKSNVDDLRTFLNEMPDEAWARESRHETLGDGMTLQLWVERGLLHIEEHLRAVRKSN